MTVRLMARQVACLVVVKSTTLSIALADSFMSDQCSQFFLKAEVRKKIQNVVYVIESEDICGS